MSILRIPDGEPLEELAVRDLAFLWGLILVQDSSGLRGVGRSAPNPGSWEPEPGRICPGRVQGSRSRGRGAGDGLALGLPSGAAGRYFSSTVPAVHALRALLAVPGPRRRANCLLISSQNTALDKEGQIFGSKLGADGSRPSLEPAAPEPPAPEPSASPESPPRSPAAAAAAAECERAGTWRRHRD